MQGRCMTSGTKPVVKGCRAPLNFTGSQLSASFERFGRWDPFVCEDHKDECVSLSQTFALAQVHS